jgi:sugar lactone lactonase YvrE
MVSCCTVLRPASRLPCAQPRSNESWTWKALTMRARLLSVYGITVATVVAAILTAATAAGAQQIYWTVTETSTILRANLDGSNTEELPTTQFGAPHDLAVDTFNEKMFWTSSEHGQLKSGKRTLLDYGKMLSADLDATHVETLFATGQTRIIVDRSDTHDVIVSGDEGPYGIALDLPHRKIYWCEFHGSRIRRCDLDGANVETLVERAGQARDIALDLSEKKVYWTTFQGEIKRANFDGTGVELLVEGLSNPHGIALDIRRGRMYWADVHRIERADMDGQNAEQIWVDQNREATGIELDLRNDKIYWADYKGQKIFRADLDGSHVEEVVPSARGKPSAIALYLKGN